MLTRQYPSPACRGWDITFSSHVDEALLPWIDSCVKGDALVFLTQSISCYRDDLCIIGVISLWTFQKMIMGQISVMIYCDLPTKMCLLMRGGVSILLWYEGGDQTGILLWVKEVGVIALHVTAKTTTSHDLFHGEDSSCCNIILWGYVPLVAIGMDSVLVPCLGVKSPQLIWRSGTRRWNLRVPDLQMSCGVCTTWQGTWILQYNETPFRQFLWI